MMRIVHLPSSYLPEHLGGTEVYVRHLCRELADLGHESAVVWHTDSETPANWDGPETQVRLSPHRPRRRADLYRKTADADPPGFRHFLADWAPDVVHFHAFTLGAGIDHARVAQDAGIPYLITYHTPAQSCPRGTLMRYGAEPCDGRIEPKRCAGCSLHGRGWPKALARGLAQSPVPWTVPDGPWVPRVAAPSLVREARERWHEFFGGAVRVVACAEFCRDVLLANGLPPEQVTVVRQALPGETRTRTLRLPIVREENRPLRLGFFGRFTPVKGPDVLIKAVRQLNEQGVATVADLVGPIVDGDRTWAERLLAENRGHVTYRGTLTGRKLTEWLESVDLVVIPSLWLETGPLTLLEAWDLERPVVGSDAGGIREFMDANGMRDLLFPIGDLDGLENVIKRLLAWKAPTPTVTVPGFSYLARQMEALYANSVSRIGGGVSHA